MWPIERKAIWKSIMNKVNILNIRLKTLYQQYKIHRFSGHSVLLQSGLFLYVLLCDHFLALFILLGFEKNWVSFTALNCHQCHKSTLLSGLLRSLSQSGWHCSTSLVGVVVVFKNVVQFTRFYIVFGEYSQVLKPGAGLLGYNGEQAEKHSSIEGSLPIEYILNYFQDHSCSHVNNCYLSIPVCLKHAFN